MTNLQPAPLYLDHAATTPVDPRVLERMLPYFSTHFGNPASSAHTLGDVARLALEQARTEVAALLDIAPTRVVFTATATEAINLGIQGFVRHIDGKRLPRILVSPLEHPSVLETCHGLAERSVAVVASLVVDSLGRIDLDQLDEECRRGVDLVCVQAANNEIGNVYPLTEIAALVRHHGGVLFSDLTQACGRLPLSLDTMGVSLGACSAHKLYGPKGAGALIVPAGMRLPQLLFGGGQERGQRPGTVNVPAVVGFGEACRLRRMEMAADEKRIGAMRDCFEAHLSRALPTVEWLGDRANRVSGIAGFLLPAVDAEAVLVRCREHVAMSTGAACSRGAPAPSHVVLALGVTRDRAHGFVRASLGRDTDGSRIDTAVAALAAAVTQTSDLLTR